MQEFPRSNDEDCLPDIR